MLMELFEQVWLFHWSTNRFGRIHTKSVEKKKQKFLILPILIRRTLLKQAAQCNTALFHC